MHLSRHPSLVPGCCPSDPSEIGEPPFKVCRRFTTTTDDENQNVRSEALRDRHATFKLNPPGLMPRNEQEHWDNGWYAHRSQKDLCVDRRLDPLPRFCTSLEDVGETGKTWSSKAP